MATDRDMLGATWNRVKKTMRAPDNSLRCLQRIGNWRVVRIERDAGAVKRNEIQLAVRRRLDLNQK